MKVLFLPLLFLFLPLLPKAQGFAGDYALPVGGGEIFLELQDAGQNQLKGRLADSDGTRYQVHALVDSRGYAKGTLVKSQGGLYFEASLNGDRLVLTIMPAGADNQPDYLNAKDFVLTRQERVRAPIELTQENPTAGTETSRFPEQPALHAGGSWDGIFYGKINEVSTQLAFRHYGNQLSGEIDAGGYKYTLEGAVSGNESWGKVLDPQTQGVMQFSGVLNGDSILVTFFGEQGRFQMQFLREGTKLPASPEALGPAGEWAYAQAPRSGEFAPSSYYLLLLRPNGSYLYGEAQAVRTNPTAKEVERGQWIARDNFILTEYGKMWRKFAAYQLKGNSLFLTFGRGAVQEWKRVD